MAANANRITMTWVLSDCWKARAVPWNAPWIVDGTPISRMVSFT